MEIIEILKFIFLGAIQGITETLPISSSGHIVIFKELTHIDVPENDLTFAILLHFGSLIAIIYFYRKVIAELFVNFFGYLISKEETKKADFKYVWLLVVATIPAGVIGILFKDFIEEKLSNILTVGISLLVTSMVLFYISKLKLGNKDKSDITFIDAIIIGVVQAIAIIPGISRSGSTVSASLSRKFDIDNALRFSFLLFIPAALGAALIDVKNFFENPEVTSNIVLYLISFLTSILFTYLSLHFFISVIKRGKLAYFSLYCFVVGLISIFISVI